MGDRNMGQSSMPPCIPDPLTLDKRNCLKKQNMEGEIKMRNLTNEIEKWAEERKLDSADPGKQILKLGEEFGELCQGFVKGKSEQVIDSIGDMFVVLTILSLQLGTTIDDCVEIAYEEIADRKGKMINGVFVKESDLN